MANLVIKNRISMITANPNFTENVKGGYSRYGGYYLLPRVSDDVSRQVTAQAAALTLDSVDFITDTAGVYSLDKTYSHHYVEVTCGINGAYSIGFCYTLDNRPPQLSFDGASEYEALGGEWYAYRVE